MEEFDYFLTNPIVSQPFLQFTAQYKAARLTPGLWTHNFVLGTVDSEVWVFHLETDLSKRANLMAAQFHYILLMSVVFASVLIMTGPKQRNLVTCTATCLTFPEYCPKASMLFVWEGLKMTVRICGEVEKLTPEESDVLFHR